VAPAANVLVAGPGPEALVPESAKRISSKGDENNSGLIAGLTTSAFLVGMLFAFLICYIHRTRRSMKRGKRGGDESSTGLPFVTPTRTRGSLSTQTLGNPSPQAGIPWGEDYHAERRDRVVDMGGPSGARSRGGSTSPV
jgi:hypothetical protein